MSFENATSNDESLSRFDVRIAICLILLLPLLRFFISEAGGFDLHFDEAQYWTWSKQLDWSYYSKGPLVAWLIAFSTSFLGKGEWQVRLFAWLAYDIFLILLFGFAYQFWQSRRAGWWAVLLGLTSPLYFHLGQVMTTDIFLFVFWSWALWAVWRALFRQDDSAWYEFGIAIGIGTMTKFSILMLPCCLPLILSFTRHGRRMLNLWPFWGGLFLFLIIISPILIWNASHNWVAFYHEQGHLLNVYEKGGGGWQENVGDLITFLGGQWLAFSPIVSVALFRSLLVYSPCSDQQRLLLTISLSILAFFITKAVITKVQLNWPAPAYIGLLVLFAGKIDGLPTIWRRLVVLGMTSSVALIIVTIFPILVGIPFSKAPFKDLRLWEEPIRKVAYQAGSVNFLMVPSYHLAGELAFYWPESLPVYPVAENRRFSQYDLWPGIEQQTGRTGIYVATEGILPERLKEAFIACQILPPVLATSANFQTLRTLYSWRCESYLPKHWSSPKTY